MSDPSGELRSACETLLKADAGVIAAFGSKPVKVFAKLPVTNIAKPYVVISGFSVSPDLADCFDSAETDAQIDIWSLTDPPGYAEAEALGAAVQAALAPVDGDGQPILPFTLTGHRLSSVLPLGTDYLDDPSDGMTVHGVVRLRFATDPA